MNFFFGSRERRFFWVGEGWKAGEREGVGVVFVFGGSWG